MQEKYSFYYQKNNKLFNNNILVVCYRATTQEIKKYNLTGENIILFLKSKEMDELIGKENVNYTTIVNKAFNREIYLRIQSECLLGIYGDSHCDCEEQRTEFIKQLNDNDGIFIHMPQEAQGWGLFYKCQELELQVNGRNQDGKFIQCMTRDDAQKYLLQTQKFNDKRSFELVANILKDLKLSKKKFVVYTESEKKIEELQSYNIDAVKFIDFINQRITCENTSEYLIKILNETHTYDKSTIDKLCDVIISRKYNERTLETLIEIINRIRTDNNYKIDEYSKKHLLNAYNEIICGEEKNYILKYSSLTKKQNKFSCQVNALIFKQLLKIYKHNIFDRICFEKIYVFSNKKSHDIKRVRTSQVLDIRDDNCPFFIGQVYNIERMLVKNSNEVIENSTSISKLRALFESTEYEYIKRHEMITYISEDDIDEISVYLKRIPNIENWVLDVYGKSENIRMFINELANQKEFALLNFVNNIQLEEGDYSEFNLRFSDLDLAVNEELDYFKKLNEGAKIYGNRN